MNKIRWGLLSTAHINRSIIPAIRSSKRGTLIAVASRSLQKAKRYADEWQIPKAFGNYESMLASGSIDAVYISLPNHLHAEWTINALNAGIHVLCEKPFALSIKEVDAMIKASRKNHLVLAEAFMYRHHPQTKLAGEWAHSGRLGDIIMVKASFHFLLRTGQDIRRTPEYGGGCLWDVGVYPISLAQFIFNGPPEIVSGVQFLGETGVDEIFSGQMFYPGKRIAQISSSFLTPFYTSAEIIGSEGRLFLSRPFTYMGENRRMIFYPKEGERLEIEVPEKDLYLGEVEDMHTAILDGTPTYLSLKESRNHIRTTVALYQSASSKQIVSL